MADATLEVIMAIPHTPGRLSINGLGWGLSAALVVLFMLCLLAALFLPMRLAHGWLALFSDAPVGSTWLWVEGLFWSIVAGWLIALVFGTVYNWIVARSALRAIADREPHGRPAPPYSSGSVVK
jgi:hypothetical protein